MQGEAAEDQVEFAVAEAGQVAGIARHAPHPVRHAAGRGPPQTQPDGYRRKIQQRHRGAFPGQHEAPIAGAAAIIEHGPARERFAQQVFERGLVHHPALVARVGGVGQTRRQRPPVAHQVRIRQFQKLPVLRVVEFALLFGQKLLPLAYAWHPLCYTPGCLRRSAQDSYAVS